MTLADWAADARSMFRELPARQAARAAGISLWMGFARRVGSAAPTYGESIWAKDWDVLVILDACRPDALEAVSAEYDFIPSTVPTMVSRASWSRKWMRETFSDQYRENVARTAYVSGNVFTRDFGEDGILPPSAFAHLDEVWRDAWDSEIGTVRPESVVDRAIQCWRQTDADQMIVHLMQPHAPYPSLDLPGHPDPSMCRKKTRRTVWDMLQAGAISEQEARKHYRRTLRWALDEVGDLLKNLSADSVAISADHAELFGEWGLHSHPDIPLPSLRRVPWVITTAEDRRTRQGVAAGSEDGAAVAERLEALGYV